MIVQKDVLMRQIERFAAGLGRVLAGETTDAVEVESETGRLAGLRVDTALSLPLATILGLLGEDPQRRLMLGVGLAGRCFTLEARGATPPPGLSEKAAALIRLGLAEELPFEAELDGILRRLDQG